MDYEKILSENKRRIDVINQEYNPITGYGSASVERIHVQIEDCPLPDMWLPAGFAETGFVKTLAKEGFNKFIKKRQGAVTEKKRDVLWREFIKERIRYDFEYWAYSFIKIKAKGKPFDINFLLNRAQRVFLKELERLRLSGAPIEIILLKARQWGGSTLIQIYMLWIQLVHRKNWNSVICGDVESQSRTVRAMVSKAIGNYPKWLSCEAIAFAPFEGSTKNRIIKNRNCVISIGSAQQPDALRSSDISMAHLTEVGVWKATEGKKPEDLVQSIVGSIYETDCSVKVLESTAKGVGNYFNREWIDAVSRKNNLSPVFIPWFMIDIYSREIDDYRKFIDSMDEYEWMLWQLGASLEAVNWYRKKSKDLKERWRMNSEFPSTPEEAFQSTGRRRFRMEDTIKLKKTCIDPEWIGDVCGETESGKNALKDIRLVQDKQASTNDENKLWIWTMPDNSGKWRDRYVTIVDVGGVSDGADFSDVLVLDRYYMAEGGIPEVVAEWHGHIDHDLLAWKAAQIATLFGNALLVIESNTLETEGTEGNNFEYILDEIADTYRNLYSRTPSDQIKKGIPAKWGFHTNTSTKPMVISHQAKVVRGELYVERCLFAVMEHDVFEIKKDGKTLGAVEGMHDDRLITRAIGNWICYKLPLPKLIITDQTNNAARKIQGEATI
ncbi:MAG: hypothetical protein LBU37_10350 [Tannerellaceae bacterium]|jgi:hypothetical protein|nr:hypothetical protein [Tannerellaceae bacterium]